MATESTRRVIVGLGNPGAQYVGTRHNIGFEAVELFAKLNNFQWGKMSGGSICASGNLGDYSITLVKPMTYMNLSGEPLMKVIKNTPIEPSEIIVVVDDIHLPIGRIRIRQGGSDGGHNGLKSITAHLQTQDYPRLRIGVGEPQSAEHQIDHVLSRFSRDEQKSLEEVLERTVAALETWITSGTETAMNKFNGG
jgi:PTH1 family peptidyl-tRNA hydrolase